MLVNKKEKFKQLSMVENPTYLVFCDFDETYYPHSMDRKKQQKLYELEDYLAEQSEKRQLMFGWVTGSSLESVFHKMDKGGFRLFPHFIASNLGTEITYFTQQHFGMSDQDWSLRLEKANFSTSVVHEIIQTLQEDYDIYLEPQTQLGSSRFKKNFYYKEQNKDVDTYNLSVIRKIAEQKGICVNINKCNPLAGDPEDSYDVDFIPSGTGKDRIVEFMLNKFDVHFDHTFAFGDSGNDLQMLKSVKYGYLVENATNEAKNDHSNISIGEYSAGILHALKGIIRE